MTMKRCYKCGEEKALCEFSKSKSRKDGLNSLCKACVKAYYEANKEKIAERYKAYQQANKDKIAKRNKAYQQTKKEKIAEQRKAYRQANKEKIAEQNKAYTQANKDKRSVYQKKRRATDPVFKMKSRVGSSVRKALKNQGKTKGGSTFSALPYAPQDLVEHLEKQFDEKMNWDNYGTYWHLDHIYPQSLLPFDNLAHPNFQKCWALDNLQPLEAIENIKKGNRVLRQRS